MSDAKVFATLVDPNGSDFGITGSKVILNEKSGEIFTRDIYGQVKQIGSGSTFVQSGTAPTYGWATRTVQAKESDIVSLLDFKCADGVAVTGDGSHDDTTGIQSALTWAVLTGTEIDIPALNFKVTATLTLTNTVGIKFIGRGSGSKFTWAGNNSTPMFLLTDVGLANVMSYFTILASATTPLLTGIEVTNGSGSTVTPRKRVFRNLFIEGTNTGITDGIRWTIGAGGDNNNDTDLIESCYVANYTNAAFKIDGTQAKDHRFVECQAPGGSGSQYAVYSNAGFSWTGGFVGNSAVADFYINNPTVGDTFLMEGTDTELSNRFLQTAGPTGAAWPVTIRNNRITTQSLNVDLKVIDFNAAGPLIVEGNAFGGGANPVPEINFNPSVGSTTVAASVSLIGNTFLSNNAVNSTHLVANAQFQVVDVGNFFMNAGGTELQVKSGTYSDVRGNILGIPAGTNASGTGVTIDKSGQLNTTHRRVQATFAAFSAAALTADLTVYTLAAGERLISVIADTVQNFHGGGTTAATLIVGTTAGGNDLILSHDVWTAAITKGLADADLGTSINRANAVQGGYMSSFSATQIISARLTTVTSNTNALTQGFVRFYITTVMTKPA